MAWAEQVASLGGPVVADHVLDARSACGREPVELVAEHDLVARDDAVEHDDVAVRPLEERPYGRDADPARDQQRLRRPARARGEHPERALREDTRSDRISPSRAVWSPAPSP